MKPMATPVAAAPAALWQQARLKAEEGRELARSLPATLHQALLRAPDSQRGIAITVMLIALAMLVGEGERRWEGVWIALQVGGGCTWMALPVAVGWSRRAIARFSAVMLVVGLLAVIGLIPILPDSEAFRQAMRHGVLVASVAAVAVSSFMVFAACRYGRTLGALGLPFAATLGVSGGAALVILGVTGWLRLLDQDAGQAVAMAVVFGMWILAFVSNRLEASRAYRGAGRLLGLRHGMVRLGAMAGGVVVAQMAVNALEATAWRAAMGTPLEGMASGAGVVAGAALGLAAAGAGLALPRLLGRLQLSGRIGPGAGGETGWFAGWMLLVASAFWMSAALTTQIETVVRYGPILHGVPVYFGEQDQGASMMALACLMVVLNGVLRVLLGRPSPVRGPALWLVLPSDADFPYAREVANRMAREWQEGPVVLLAPPTMAPRVRGAELRLAEAAGSGAELFLGSALDAKAWLMRASTETGASALRLREIYAGAEAARVLVSGVDAEARMLVLADGPLAEGWARVMAALPSTAERITRSRPMDAAWRELDYAVAANRTHLITDFLVRRRPRPRPQRRVLILHAPPDHALAERLAAALEGTADPQGACVVATFFDPLTTAGRALAWSGGTWLTLLGLLSRVAERGELGRLGQLVWHLVPPLHAQARSVRVDLVVIESDWGEAPLPAARGLERMVDSVIGLMPAMSRHGLPTLYPPEAYDRVLHLPAPSALAQSLPLLARRLLDGSEQAAGSVEGSAAAFKTSA